MRALHWDGKQLRVRNSYPEPTSDKGNVVLGVRLAGICSTDLQILRGYMGFTGVPGHELVGEVESGPEEWLGQRVVAEINFACGECEDCARGNQRHCARRAVMGILDADGAFAEKIRVPLANLHRVPDELSDEQAVFAEPLAAAGEILDQVDLDGTQDVLVLGDGKLGLLCAQVLRPASHSVTLVGKHERKLGLAGSWDVEVCALDGWKPARPWDVVVEVTGTTRGLEMALEVVRPRGALVLKSTVASEHTVSLAPVVINEVSVIGSRCGRFPPALDALSAKRVDVCGLVDETYRLADGLKAVEHAQRAGALKVLLAP